MTLATINRRLRKLEGEAYQLDADGFPVIPPPWFFVCGRSEDAIRATHAACPDAPASYVPVLWTAADPVPEPYWADEASDEVLEAWIVTLRAMDREAADRPTTERDRRAVERMTDAQLQAMLVSPFVIHTRPQ